MFCCIIIKFLNKLFNKSFSNIHKTTSNMKQEKQK